MVQLVCSPWHNICLRMFAVFSEMYLIWKKWEGEMKNRANDENLKFEGV